MSAGFWWIILALALYGGLHSLLAAGPAKALAQRWFGEGGRRWYRLFFSVFGALSFLPVLALVGGTGDVPIYRIPAPWAYAALAGAGLGALMVAGGVLQTGALAFIGLRPEAQPPRLVTGGLYRWVRHPLYTGSLLAIWLNPALSWNTLALNLGVTLYLLVGLQFEERKLAQAFGPAYTEYARRTARLIPGLF